MNQGKKRTNTSGEVQKRKGKDEPMLNLLDDDLVEWRWSELRWAGSHSKT